MASLAEEKVRKAVTKIILKEPWYGTLITKLEFEQMSPELSQAMTKGHGNATMATDGRKLYFDPDWTIKLTDSEVKGVLIHEILHCAFLHQLRVRERDAEFWNAACDYAINAIVKEKFTLPEPHLDEIKYHGMSAERIYDKLVDENAGEGKKLIDPRALIGQVIAPGSGDPQSGNDPTDGMTASQSAAEQKAEELDWKSAVSQATQTAKNKGDIPGGLSDLLDFMLKPKIPWRQVLYNFLKQTTYGRYNWRHRHNRSEAFGFYMPRRGKEKTGDIVFAIDTSGSMSNKEIQAALSEVQYIAQEVKPRQLVIIQCDASVQRVDKYDVYDDLPDKFDIMGRGGTRFTPVFDHIEDDPDIDPDCLIYVTDMYGDFPKHVDYPVLWTSTTEDITAPIGETIYLDID